MLIIHNAKTLRLLLNLFLVFFASVKGGQSLLHVAASKGDVAAVHHLIDLRVNLNVQDRVRTLCKMWRFCHKWKIKG